MASRVDRFGDSSQGLWGPEEDFATLFPWTFRAEVRARDRDVSLELLFQSLENLILGAFGRRPTRPVLALVALG